MQVLYGLPRLLTGSILAHECMHAWLRMSGFSASASQQVEEGLCQLMALLWLEAQQAQVGRGGACRVCCSCNAGPVWPPGETARCGGMPPEAPTSGPHHHRHNHTRLPVRRASRTRLRSAWPPSLPTRFAPTSQWCMATASAWPTRHSRCTACRRCWRMCGGWAPSPRRPPKTRAALGQEALWHLLGRGCSRAMLHCCTTM